MPRHQGVVDDVLIAARGGLRVQDVVDELKRPVEAVHLCQQGFRLGLHENVELHARMSGLRDDRFRAAQRLGHRRRRMILRRDDLGLEVARADGGTVAVGSRLHVRVAGHEIGGSGLTLQDQADFPVPRGLRAALGRDRGFEPVQVRELRRQRPSAPRRVRSGAPAELKSPPHGINELRESAQAGVDLGGQRRPHLDGLVIAKDIAGGVPAIGSEEAALMLLLDEDAAQGPRRDITDDLGERPGRGGRALVEERAAREIRRLDARRRRRFRLSRRDGNRFRKRKSGRAGGRRGG